MKILFKSELEAVRNNCEVIEFIENPSEEVLLAALKGYRNITYKSNNKIKIGCREMTIDGWLSANESVCDNNINKILLPVFQRELQKMIDKGEL